MVDAAGQRMTRDETVALFLKCGEARQAAIEAGKHEADADRAARAVWNVWAEPLLAEIQAMKQGGKWWPKVKSRLGDICVWDKEAEDLAARAAADFSSVRFGPPGLVQ